MHIDPSDEFVDVVGGDGTAAVENGWGGDITAVAEYGPGGDDIGMVMPATKIDSQNGLDGDGAAVAENGLGGDDDIGTVVPATAIDSQDGLDGDGTAVVAEYGLGAGERAVALYNGLGGDDIVPATAIDSQDGLDGGDDDIGTVVPATAIDLQDGLDGDDTAAVADYGLGGFTPDPTWGTWDRPMIGALGDGQFGQYGVEPDTLPMGDDGWYGASVF